jgi:hypothetical protein
MGQSYRTAGRVRGRQSDQAGGLRVRTGKGQNQETEKKKDWEKQELRPKTLVDLTNKTNWQQTDRKRRYKYPDDKWGRWATPGGGWRQAQGQVKQFRV